MVVRIHIYLLLVVAYMFAIQRLDVFLVMYLFVFMHELAHMIVALICGVDVEEIELLPIGVHAKLGSFYNQERPRCKFCKSCDLLIFLAGPCFSFWMASVCEYDVFSMMNFAIGVFNLIPVKPFDGGNILECVLGFVFGERVSERIMGTLTRFFLNLLVLCCVALAVFEKNYYFVILGIYVVCIVKQEAQNTRFNALISYLQID